MSPPLPLWKQKSPFEPSLLHGTHPAPQLVKRHLQILRSELENAHTEATNLRNAVKVAETDIVTIQSVIDVHCRILPNINDLMPSEILAHIFSFTFTAPFNAYDYDSGPWILGKVCQQWRIVAWQTPTLWSSFSLVPTNLSISRTTPRFQDMLTRSRHCPLTVHMESAPFDIQTITIQHCSRFKSLFISDCDPSIYSPGALKLHEFSMLMDLTIETANSSFSFPPNLRRLKYKGPVASLVGPLPRLTHLSIDVAPGSSVRDYLAALSQCPNLVTFEDHTYSWPVNDFGQNIVHFPRLERLLLHRLSMIHIFTCPALRTFVLSKGEPLHEDITEFDSFLDRSACNLLEVMIEGETDSTFNFMDIFPRVPRIEIDLSKQSPRELFRALFCVASSTTPHSLRIILPVQTIVCKDKRYLSVNRILLDIARSRIATQPWELTYNLSSIQDDDGDYDEDQAWFTAVDCFMADRVPAWKMKTVHAMIQDTRLYRTLVKEGLLDRLEIDVINFEDWVTY